MWSRGVRSISSRQFLKVFDYFYTRPHQVQHASTSAGQHMLKNSRLIKDNHKLRIKANASMLQRQSPNWKCRSFVTITKTSVGDSINSSNYESDENIQVPNKNENSTINITQSCIERIHKLAEIKKLPPSSLYLRVFVDTGGCSGFQYQFEILTYEEEPLDNDDVSFPVGESSVVIDQDSLDMMKGSTVDYVTEMIRSGFKITENPLSESACGCGSSFAIKNFEANRGS